MWNMLRNKGDHMNNKRVLSEGEGEIIISRRQHQELDISKYGPCPSCFVWLKLDKTMFRHQKICPGGRTTVTTNELLCALFLLDTLSKIMLGALFL